MTDIKASAMPLKWLYLIVLTLKPYKLSLQEAAATMDAHSNRIGHNHTIIPKLISKQNPVVVEVVNRATKRGKTGSEFLKKRQSIFFVGHIEKGRSAARKRTHQYIILNSKFLHIKKFRQVFHTRHLVKSVPRRNAQHLPRFVEEAGSQQRGVAEIVDGILLAVAFWKRRARMSRRYWFIRNHNHRFEITGDSLSLTVDFAVFNDGDIKAAHDRRCNVVGVVFVMQRQIEKLAFCNIDARRTVGGCDGTDNNGRRTSQTSRKRNLVVKFEPENSTLSRKVTIVIVKDIDEKVVSFETRVVRTLPFDRDTEEFRGHDMHAVAKRQRESQRIEPWS